MPSKFSKWGENMDIIAEIADIMIYIISDTGTNGLSLISYSC